jgi:hypothetical protein
MESDVVVVVVVVVIVVVMAVWSGVCTVSIATFLFSFFPFLFLIRTNNSDDVIGTAIIIVLCRDSRYNE